jgi:hypothetical protein
MSALLHLDNNYIRCVGLYDTEPVRGEKMDAMICDFACVQAKIKHDEYVSQNTTNPPACIVQPPVTFKYQRVQTMPSSFASYPIGSILALQEDDFTIQLSMVVNRDVGWIRTNIRHRTISLGACKLVPVEQPAMSAYVMTKLTTTAQNHIRQMNGLEQELIKQIEKNEILEDKCQRLLDCARKEVGDKVAFAALNDIMTPPKMSYTPLE